MNAEEAKQEMASQSRCPQQRSPPPAPPGKQRETVPELRSWALAAALARAVGAASKRGAVVGAGVGCRDAPLDCGGSLAAGVRPFCLPLADFFFHSQTQVGASRPGCHFPQHGEQSNEGQRAGFSRMIKTRDIGIFISPWKSNIAELHVVCLVKGRKDRKTTRGFGNYQTSPENASRKRRFYNQVTETA